MKKSAAILCMILALALILSSGCATRQRVETVTTYSNGVKTTTTYEYVDAVVYPDPDDYYYTVDSVTHHVYFGVDAVWVRSVPNDYVVLRHYWRPTPYYRSHFHKHHGHHHGYVDVNVDLDLDIHGAFMPHHSPRFHSQLGHKPFSHKPRFEPPRQQAPHNSPNMNHPSSHQSPSRSAAPSRSGSPATRSASPVQPPQRNTPTGTVTPARPMRSVPSAIRSAAPAQQHSSPNAHSPSLLNQKPSRQPSHASSPRQQTPARAVTPARPATRSVSPVQSPQRSAPARSVAPVRSLNQTRPRSAVPARQHSSPSAIHSPSRQSQPRSVAPSRSGSPATRSASPARSLQRSMPINRSKPARPMNNGKRSNGRNK
ncbi:MAG: hypothetical protein WCT16_05020 [Candidatus Buchananbacteria bacterium]